MNSKFIFTSILFTIFAHVNAMTIPVVTVEENDRLEELADERGANEWNFMTNAGLAVSLEAEKMVNFSKASKITVLVGKGYNGGNALWAGYLLQQKGYPVTAYLLFPSEQSPSICQEIGAMFRKIGGEIRDFDPTFSSDADLLIDGILGASFKGSAIGTIAQAINWANDSKRPILSVDIPSGLNGTTGEVGTVSIQANHTVTFFFPRIGCFINQGTSHVGTLSVYNLGIDGNVLSELNPKAHLVNRNECTPYLELSTIQKLTRQELAHLTTFEDYQDYSEKNQTPILLTDQPMMLIEPSKKPIIFNDAPLYKISRSGQVSQKFDFFED